MLLIQMILYVRVWLMYQSLFRQYMTAENFISTISSSYIRIQTEENLWRMNRTQKSENKIVTSCQLCTNRFRPAACLVTYRFNSKIHMNFIDTVLVINSKQFIKYLIPCFSHSYHIRSSNANTLAGIQQSRFTCRIKQMQKNCIIHSPGALRK